MSRDKLCVRVLVAPLDWGLGHAARCIPVIHAFLQSGCEVILGTSGNSGTFLKNQFPELESVDFPCLKIRYSLRHVFFRLLLQLPGILFMTIREHRFLKRYAAEWDIDLIISDNRYGLYHKEIHSVILTHQLFIRLPVLFSPLRKIPWKITGIMLSRFDECWIPDLPEPSASLSNELSHGKIKLAHYRYIGLLSRFTDAGKSGLMPPGKNIDLLVILSGPEPQRTIFEDIIMNQSAGLNITTMVFRGLPSADKTVRVKNGITMTDHPGDEDFMTAVKHAGKIICRSGYSTIMDLIVLKRQALLVPTPGQTEQVYLARYLAAKDLFLHMSQKDFNMKAALMMLEKKQAPGYPGFRTDGSLLNETVRQLTDRVSRWQKP
jgi:predicted glycosyltransferase